MVGELVEAQIADRMPQVIQVTAEGDAFGSIVPGLTTMDSVDEDHSYDPVALFAVAVNLGLLGGDVIEPWKSKATIIQMSSEERLRQLTWQLQLENLPLSAFRVLLNMVRSLRFSHVLMASLKPAGALIETNQLLAIPYSLPFRPVPFPVDYVPPLRSSKDRLVQVIFSAPPPDAVVEEAYRAMEIWSGLIMLGAYARTDQHPSQSGGLPDMAILLDEVTIEQAFPEALFCDEAAFHAVVNWAQCMHRGHAIEQIRIR